MKQLTRVMVMTVLILLFAGVAAAQTPEITVEKMVSEPEPLQTGQYANVWFKVFNNGTEEAENVTVAFDEEFPFSVKAGERSEWRVRSIEAGEGYSFRLNVLVDRSAVSGDEELTFWTSRDNTGARRTHRLPVEVRDDDTALIVDMVGFPERVSPGSTNEMTVTLRNLANTQFQNIDVDLDLADLPLAVADASRKRVQRIDGGNAANVTYRVFVDEEADRGVYQLPVELDYENIAGNGFTQEQTTGVVVGGTSNIDIGVERTDIRTAGTRGELNLRVVNRGNGEARFVAVELPDSDDYEVLSTSDVYVGDMIPDDYQTADFDLYVNGRQGNLTVPVQVSYVNAQGQEAEAVQEVRLPLYGEEMLQTYGYAGESSRMQYLVLLAVIVLIAGVVLWRRRRG